MGKRAMQDPVDSGTGAQGGAELLRDADRPAAWVLLVDGVAQSHVDLDDPRYLDFEYVRRLGHVIDTAAPPGQQLRVLHLGAGALTLARYVAATRPGSAQLAVDADAALVDLVRSRLPVRGVRVRIRIGDAREVLERLRPGSFDVVIADVFAGGQTPPGGHGIRGHQPGQRVPRERLRARDQHQVAEPPAAQHSRLGDEAHLREDRACRRDLRPDVRERRAVGHVDGEHARPAQHPPGGRRELR
jgi:hypothetical protein